MPQAEIQGVQLTTMRAVVPAREIALDDEAAHYPGGEAQLARMKTTLGLDRRRVVEPGQTALDLGEIAVREALCAVDWPIDSLDAVLFVTQTPDHLQPGNAALLHGRLGLSTTCAAFDVNQGCAGYVYGLWLAHSLIAAGGCQRILLVGGDTLSRIIHPEDRALAPLFGDAAAATLLEANAESAAAYFNLQADGSGHAALQHPASGLRAWPSPENAVAEVDAEGHRRSPQNLQMDGAAVFGFSITRAPQIAKAALAHVGVTADTLGTLWLHQANHYIANNVAKRVGVPCECTPMASFSRFGNTSSASIPLAWACEPEAAGPHLLVGFGVGLSWGAAFLRAGWQYPPALIDLAKA